jgi:DNA processing protein
MDVEAALRVVTTPAWCSSRPEVGYLRARDPAWPAALYDLPQGPVVLTWEGSLSLLSRPMVAVVGARACTPYGREWAARIAAGVAAAGGVVVSGLAAGVDLAAHEAANGATVAVLGQGIDARMAGWQRRAREALLARGGLVLSELPPDAHADTHTFPIRNRIIAGLARVVVVVEAGERSGTRNTASHALRYGRDVMALPGPLGAPASVGCLDLLEQGATMVRGVASVLAEAGLARGPSDSDPAEGLRELLATPRTPEELMAATGRPHVWVAERLGILELTGEVIRLPGRRYQARTR